MNHSRSLAFSYSVLDEALRLQSAVTDLPEPDTRPLFAARQVSLGSPTYKHEDEMLCDLLPVISTAVIRGPFVSYQRHKIEIV